jgi:hypothetical protein
MREWRRDDVDHGHISLDKGEVVVWRATSFSVWKEERRKMARTFNMPIEGRAPVDKE